MAVVSSHNLRVNLTVVLHDWRRGAQYYSDHTGTASADVNVAGVERTTEISQGDIASRSQIRTSSIKGLSKDVVFWAAPSHRLLGVQVCYTSN